VADWRLSSKTKAEGLLNKTDKFLGHSNLTACIISVPTSMDTKQAIMSLSGIVSAGIRSFELWWDSKLQTLDIVIVASKADLDKFKQSLINAYPNIDFEDLDNITPEWFDKTNHYELFDVGYQHGHFFTIFDKLKAYQIISNIANTIQLSKHAWIQIVFKSYPLVDVFQKFLQKTAIHYKTITRTDYTSQYDGFLSSNGPGDHPEKYGEFAKNFKTIENYTSLKTQSLQTIVSVRGLVDSNNELDLDFSPIESLPVENLRSAIEHMSKNTYPYSDFFNEKKPKHIKINSKKTKFQRIDIFEQRLLPEPKQHLPRIINDYTGKTFLTGNYKERQSPPFLILSPEEIPLIIHLPDPKIPNLILTRKQAMPHQQINKEGFCLGYESRKKTLSYIPEQTFGKIIHAAETKSVVLSPEDIATHLYGVAATKGGKTTLVRAIAKHLEMANLNNVFPNSFIFVDPKGSDSYDFIKQCENESFELDRVHFLDPIETNYSLNIFELPPYTKENRDAIVELYIGHIMTMIKHFYGDSDSFVRLTRILLIILQYLYIHEDKPTFLDLYDIIIAIQTDKESILPKMFRELGKPDDILELAMKQMAEMSKEVFDPILNRIEKFTLSKTLRHLFCVRESTIDFQELITPGHITIIRLSPLNIPENFIPLIKQAIVVKIWFMIQERANKIKIEDNRTQVVLALDEFQDVADLPVINTILTQARSYKLCLLLSHQNATQIEPNLFETIIQNVGTQFVGKVGGYDAARFGKIWDPTYFKEIESQLTTQEFHHWTAKLIAKAGEVTPLPVQFWPIFTPKDKQTDEFLEQFIKSQKVKYGYGVVGESLLQRYSSQSNE